jgi:hypothetical protein
MEKKKRSAAANLWVDFIAGLALRANAATPVQPGCHRNSELHGLIDLHRSTVHGAASSSSDCIWISNMSNNFAPYQDVAPDVTRSLSPPPMSPPPKSPSPRVPTIQHQNFSQARAISPPTSPSYQNSQDYLNFPSNDNAQGSFSGGRDAADGPFWSSRSGIDLYETSLGMRLDWEACLAYLGLPPAGAALLLMFEHRSDYVRYAQLQGDLLSS